MNITVKQQRCNQWCWAAIIEAVSWFYTPAAAVSQCQAVDRCVFEPLGQPGFCSANCDCKFGQPGGQCDTPFDVGQALFNFNFAVSPNGFAPDMFSFGQISAEIQAGRPLVASWESSISADFSHAVIVIDTSGDDTVTVANPIDASVQSFSYSQLVAGGPQWRWQTSFPTVNLNG